MLKLFLADDHAVVREGLRSLINAQPDMTVVGEAEDGLAACAQIPQLKPDVVIMDLSMPGLTGTQATVRLRQDCPDTKILALTMHEEKGYISQLMSAGASGYVLKRSAAGELIHAIEVVASGKVYLDPEIAGKVVTGFVNRSGDTHQKEGLALSGREQEIACLTAAGHSNKEIAAQLELSVKTVETYRARCMKKLGVSTRAELVRHAIHQGWLKDD